MYISVIFLLCYKKLVNSINNNTINLGSLPHELIRYICSFINFDFLKQNEVTLDNISYKKLSSYEIVNVDMFNNYSIFIVREGINLYRSSIRILKISNNGELIFESHKHEITNNFFYYQTKIFSFKRLNRRNLKGNILVKIIDLKNIIENNLKDLSANQESLYLTVKKFFNPRFILNYNFILFDKYVIIYASNSGCRYDKLLAFDLESFGLKSLENDNLIRKVYFDNTIRIFKSNKGIKSENLVFDNLSFLDNKHFNLLLSPKLKITKLETINIKKYFHHNQKRAFFVNDDQIIIPHCNENQLKLYCKRKFFDDIELFNWKRCYLMDKNHSFIALKNEAFLLRENNLILKNLHAQTQKILATNVLKILYNHKKRFFILVKGCKQYWMNTIVCKLEKYLLN